MRIELIALELKDFKTKEDILIFLNKFNCNTKYLNIDELMNIKDLYKVAYIDIYSGCLFALMNEINDFFRFNYIDIYEPFLDFIYNMKAHDMKVDNEIITMLDLIESDKIIDYSKYDTNILENILKISIEKQDFESAILIKKELDERKKG